MVRRLSPLNLLTCGAKTVDRLLPAWTSEPYRTIN
jgi:hypothetical protein